MFRAYSENNKTGTGEQSSSSGRPAPEPSYDRDQYRLAVQTATARRYKKQEAQKRKAQEQREFVQCGLGESDEEDCGGVRIAVPLDQQFDEEEVFLHPEIRKQREFNRVREEISNARRTPSNPYNTFPAGKRAKSPETRRRSRSRSRDRKKKKKTKSRRRSSSSSSSSSGYSRRRKSPPPKKMAVERVKYEFLTEQEYATRHNLSTRIMIRDVRLDHENFSLGQPRKEIANCRLNVRFIDGLQHNPAIFNRLYGVECARDRKDNRPFHEQLAGIAKMIPTETHFRPVKIKDGFWRLSQKRDLLNSLNVKSEGEEEDDAILEDHQQLRRRVQENVHDIEAILQLIEMENEMSRTNTGSFARGNRRAVLDRHMSMIENAMRHNPRNVYLHVLHLDHLIRLDTDPITIHGKYTRLLHKFPHDALAWTRYLDFVQYGHSYSHRNMWNAFSECLSKVGGLVAGTLLSHTSQVEDADSLRQFYVFVFTRFLKWLIAAGLVPVALANVQAAFELNFGLGAQVHTMNATTREIELRRFLNTRLPRIGDSGATGAEKWIKSAPESDIVELEMVDHEIMMFKASEAIAESFKDVDRPLETGWIEFERKMLDIDARAKRTDLKESPAFRGDYSLDIGLCHIWEPVRQGEILIFYATQEFDEIELVQPILEVLGLVFRYSTGCFSPTESLIETWRAHGTLPLDTTIHFDSVPTYSETTLTAVGLNILAYLIEKRHETAKQEASRLDDLLVTYLTAFILTKANEFERDADTLFYRLKAKHLNVLLEDGVEKSYADILATYANLHAVLRIVAVEKFVGWLELAALEQTRVATHERAALQLGYCIVDKDRKALEEAQRKVFRTLEKCSPLGDPNLTNVDSPLVSVQITMYSVLLRARATMRNQKTVRMLLAMSILHLDRKAAALLETSAEYGQKVRMAVVDVVEAVARKEEAFIGLSCVPEFPTAGALADALQIVVDFAFLEYIPHARLAVAEIVARSIEKCDQFVTLRADTSRSPNDKKQDARDMELLLDTLLFVLAEDPTHTEHYTRIVRTAVELFPCMSKYAQRFARLHSTSKIRMIGLALHVDERNRRVSSERRTFDMEHERRALINSLTAMYGSMQAGSDGGSRRTVYEAFRKEAIKLNDPAVWRLAVKAAARVDRKCLADDAYVRAQGHCPGNLNVHFDYIEGRTMQREQSSGRDEEPLDIISLMRNILNDNDRPHRLFVDDPDFLTTQREIAVNQSQNSKRECADEQI